MAYELTGETDLHFLPVRTLPFSEPLQCYDNCHLASQVLGGEMVLGYLIWTTKDLFVTAEHHCVLRLPGGRLVDLTPQVNGASTTLFARSHQPATLEFLDEFLMTGTTGGFKAVVDHPCIHEVGKVLDDASVRLHRHKLETARAGRDVSLVEQHRWEAAIAKAERLLDTYFRQRQRKAEHQQRQFRRKRRKAERMAKKRNRAR